MKRLKPRLYYYKDHRGNFGDDLNLWLWPKILNDLVNYEDPYYAFCERSKTNSSEILFVGLGSILSDKIPSSPTKLVLGAGFAYGDPPVVEKNWRIYCVRGPLSAEALGIDKKLSITDSGILVSTIPLASPSKKHRASFMAYHETAEMFNLRSICRILGINYIDPGDSVDHVLKEILSSEVLITEAMHGAIVADSLRVPWVPVKAFRSINNFKWKDWCSSVGLEYKPHTLSELTLKKIGGPREKAIMLREIAKFVVRLARLPKNTDPVLSTATKFDSIRSRMVEAVENLRQDLIYL